MKNIYVHDTLTETIKKLYLLPQGTSWRSSKNVAAHYAVTEEQHDWNGLKTTNIYIGQHLRIESEKGHSS